MFCSARSMPWVRTAGEIFHYTENGIWMLRCFPHIRIISEILEKYPLISELAAKKNCRKS